MECRHALGLLEAYLDNELDRSEARELEAHVDACADCRAALTRLADLRTALRDSALRFRAPDRLRERVAASARRESAIEPIPMLVAPARRIGLPARWRLAAACVLAFVAGGVSMNLLTPAAPGALVAHDLFASHWRALAAATPVDVVSSDRHTVKPWFEGKVAQAPLVRDFAGQGFALVGGRIDYVGTQRVPVLVYRHGRHLIDVFVLPDADAAAVSRPLEQQGYAARAIALGSQRAVIVSDMDAQESAALAALLSAPL